MRPTLGSTLPGLARAGRAWLLWLALAVVAAHSLAAWHVYSHGLAEEAARFSGKKQAASETCAICIAIAGIGGGAPAQPTWQPERFAHEAPLPVRCPVPHLAPQPRPYAIRAPPVLTA
jgi:phosphatidylglycerophosphate synthase